jgi:hypothetical protein
MKRTLTMKLIIKLFDKETEICSTTYKCLDTNRKEKKQIKGNKSIEADTESINS